MERTWWGRLRDLILVRRPVATTMIVVLAIAVAGTIASGPGFLAKPLPVPPKIAAIAYTINFFLLVFAIFTTYRNVNRWLDSWTWQELAFTRGTLLLMFGGVLGYGTRVFQNPTLTLGTPVITAGACALLWATLSPPERLTKEDGQ